MQCSAVQYSLVPGRLSRGCGAGSRAPRPQGRRLSPSHRPAEWNIAVQAQQIYPPDLFWFIASFSEKFCNLEIFCGAADSGVGAAGKVVCSLGVRIGGVATMNISGGRKEEGEGWNRRKKER